MRFRTSPCYWFQHVVKVRLQPATWRGIFGHSQSLGSSARRPTLCRPTCTLDRGQDSILQRNVHHRASGEALFWICTCCHRRFSFSRGLLFAHSLYQCTHVFSSSARAVAALLCPVANQRRHSRPTPPPPPQQQRGRGWTWRASETACAIESHVGRSE